MAAGMARLSAQIAKQLEAREGVDEQGERNVVVMVVSDDVRLSKQLERLGREGGGMISAFILVSAQAQANVNPSSLAKGADVILGWEKLKYGEYITTTKG